jgi:hypothetical protein
MDSALLQLCLCPERASEPTTSQFINVELRILLVGQRSVLQLLTFCFDEGEITADIAAPDAGD